MTGGCCCKLGVVAHYVSTNPPVVLRRFFKSDRSTRSGAAPRRRQNAIFFLQSFFFWGYFLKRKSVKGISVSIDSASNYSNFLPLTHFFFETIGTTRTPKTRLRSFRGTPARKSSQKEMPNKGYDGNPQSSYSFAFGNPYAPLTAPLLVESHF